MGISRPVLLSDLLKRYCLPLLVLFAIPLLLHAQPSAPLKLIQSIPLPGLKEGDFDHFAVDLDGHRLFLTVISLWRSSNRTMLTIYTSLGKIATGFRATTAIF